MAHTLRGFYGDLREHRATAPWRDPMVNFEEINEIIGTPALMEEARRYM